MASLKYWIWLSTRPGVGARSGARLLEAFGSPEQVYFAEEKQYRELTDLRENELRALLIKDLTAPRKAIERCEENGYRIITLQDTMYPARLKNIYDPPIVLYVRGRAVCLDEEAALAVVGTRSCTPYGLKAAERVGYEFTKAGGLIVTGLARGIDTAAAKGALRAGGRVVAVIGCGLDVVYPAENKALFEDVASTGAIFSEYPPGTAANSGHFPVRNRILSGISLGVCVIEAPKRSGALITASNALEQGRDVFAIPGNVDSPACEGSNELLRDGAQLVMSGFEIADEYRARYPEKLGRKTLSDFIPLDETLFQKLVEKIPEEDKMRPETPKKEIDNNDSVEYIDLVKRIACLSEDERKVVAAVTLEPVHIDEIIESCGLPASLVLSALTMLEINGIIRQQNGKLFSLML